MAGLYSVSVTLTPLGGSYLALLRGRAIGIVEAAYNIVSRLALLAVGIATLAAGWKPSGVIAAFVLVDVVSSLALPEVAKPRLTLSADPDPLQRAELQLRATLPLAAAGIIGSAYERVDIWLLALMKGSSSVAIYVAAYKFYDTVLLPAMAMASAAVPAVGSDLTTNARPVARRLALRAVAVAAPIALVVALLSPHLLRAAFGNHYGSASTAVNILMVAGLPGAALAVVTPIALLARRTYIARLTAAGLVGNVGANLILVPTVGIEGAAIAFLITDVLLLAAFYAALPQPGSGNGRGVPDGAHGPVPRTEAAA
jgi:O-antigen/teichoic acid export membrane protein